MDEWYEHLSKWYALKEMKKLYKIGDKVCGPTRAMSLGLCVGL